MIELPSAPTIWVPGGRRASRIFPASRGGAYQPEKHLFDVSGFVPPTFPDLLLWLDAGKLVTQSGGFVSAWGDLSSYGNNCAQGTAARQPAFGASVINGQPALQFTGATDNRFMLGSIASTGAGEPQFHNWTIGAVWQQNTGNQQGAVCDFTTAGGLTNVGPVLMQNSGNRSHRWGGVDTQFATTTTAARSNFCTDSFVAGPNNITFTIYQANVSQATQTIGIGATTQPITQYRIGRLFQDVFPLNGDIAEVFAYKIPLGSTDLTAWQTYFTAKYAV